MTSYFYDVVKVRNEPLVPNFQVWPDCGHIVEWEAYVSISPETELEECEGHCYECHLDMYGEDY